MGARSRTSAAPADPAPLTFYGRGYGHGVGMSQYGARGRALAGQDAATILAHYYQGTTVGQTDPARPVRVLVLQGFRSSLAHPLRLYGRGGPWTIDGIAATFPRDAQLRVSKTATGGFRVIVRSASGALLLDRATKGSLRVRSGGASGARIQVWSKPSAYDRYRGVIRLHSTAAGIDAINETQLDLYLRGVVPAEMPAGWPAEALQAQAIAARSYAAHRLHPGPGSGTSTTTPGPRSTAARWASRPARTRRSRPRRERLSRAARDRQHAVPLDGGGATEDNENVFTSATGQIVAGPVVLPPRLARREPGGAPFDAAAPRESWQTASVHARPALRRVRRRRPDERRPAQRPRPVERGRVRAAHQRHAHRQPRHEDGVRGGLPRRLQRRDAGCRPVHVEHARLDVAPSRSAAPRPAGQRPFRGSGSSRAGDRRRGRRSA